ncbi:hypothetical protein [Fusobacterium pseudoperiodonticum]|uniref:Uncharacterized protein n=1 Tax=Fusobacterium pseudoperiodonticum TaxID=2663009 RepID=A0A2G9EI60_9FUSO|nr:hypothetical protein [Fusobacterium pseudoperiodonticum]PIM80617.1 hypothetical protein CTM71_09715 [Fusobacterium pseudoperiodonticum]
MFKFLKSIFSNEENKDEETQKKDKDLIKTTTGFSMADSIYDSTTEAGKTFYKSEIYNRENYDSTYKADYKKNIFQNNEEVRDSYTGKILVSNEELAKELYEDDWAKHSAETDHIVPLKKIHAEHKKDKWIKEDDIKDIANKDKNYEIISKSTNTAKGPKTNEEFVNSVDEKHGISDENKKLAIERGDEANTYIEDSFKKRSIKNMLETGHTAGKNTMVNAGVTTMTTSGTMNLIAYIKGDISGTEALKNTANDTIKSGATGYALGNSLTLVSHTLSDSSSKFIQALVKSNVPGKVITAVMTTGNTLKRYANNEISTQECIMEIGEKGINCMSVGYAMAAGQTLIPIPVIGAAIGALIGSVVVGKYSNGIKENLKIRELEHQKRLELIAEYEKTEKQAKQFKEELDAYLKSYFKEYQDCFDEALFEIKYAFQNGDADSIIKGANKITEKLGGEVKYNNIKEFKDFLMDDSIDTF